MRKTTLKNPGTDPIDTYAGARLKERRLALNMSQTELGNAAGISFQQIQKYERGINRIAVSMLQKFAGALRVPVTYFLEPATSGNGMASANKTAAYDSGTSRDATELLALFEGINDPKLRKQVLELTKTLSKAKPAGKKK
ncbi:MAG: helix-turn-helix domain-containing protein [Bdellovibrionales bacterium]